MIIYNKTWLNNLRIKDTAENWFHKSLIGQPRLTTVNEHYVSGYKHTNLFVRIGLFLFTFILANSAIGLLMLFIGETFEKAIGILLIICGGGTWYLLEIFVKERKLSFSTSLVVLFITLLHCSIRSLLKLKFIMSL